jgi:signal transduction histidine kinase
VDVVIAVLFVLLDLVVTVTGGSWWPQQPGALAWTLLGLQVLAGLSLALRRRFPMTVLGILTAFTLAVTVLVWPIAALTPEHDGNIWAPFATVIAAYGPIIACRGRWVAYAGVALLTFVAARPWQPDAALIAIAVSRTAIGPLVALYVDARHRLVLALTERAERAEREKHLLAERARADERRRLAGEMHDVVTHRVSLMVLQAGALGITARDEQTRRAAEEMRAAGSQALEELRDLVRILRSTPQDAASPRTPDLASLVADSTRAGMPTDLISDGDPRQASPLVARTTHQIVREALTNAHKHAPGAHAVVRVQYDATQVQIRVDNSASESPPDPALAGTGSGMGIPALRQRVEAVQGAFLAGPRPDGGFRVEARLPAYLPTAEPVG